MLALPWLLNTAFSLILYVCTCAFVCQHALFLQALLLLMLFIVYACFIGAFWFSEQHRLVAFIIVFIICSTEYIFPSLFSEQFR